MVPVAQARVPVGVVEAYLPFLEPQTPAIGTAPVAQESVVPLFTPMQVQDQGPEPETVEAFPELQRLVKGIEERLAPSEEPQSPLTGSPPVAQVSSVPPFVPEQLQSQGPLPVTLDAVPVVQRLIVGCSVKFCPSEEPQTPLTGVPFLEAEQEAESPPFCPGQVQVVEEPSSGKEGEEGFEVPMVQKVSLPYVVSVYVYVLEAVPQEPAVGSAVAKELVTEL